MTKIAAVVMASRSSEMEKQARAALKLGADLVELRLDHVDDLTPGSIKHLAHAVGQRAIATLRSGEQGGAKRLPAERRADILGRVCRAGFLYVDVELQTDTALIEELHREVSKHYQDLIVSYHFQEPVEVSDAADALEACMAVGDVGKAALPIVDIEAAMSLVEFSRNQALQSKRYVLIGMGDQGIVTRALAEDLGQEIEYAHVGRPSAAGQFALETALRLKKKTPIVLGLVGHPLGHSISPQIHEAAFAALRLPALYLPFDVEPRSLGSLLDAHERLRLRGFNVTIPHKEAIAELVDELDGDSEALGAVNTVVMSEGWTRGHNTDVHGFRMALRSQGLRLGDRDALVIGAGGGAKAVVHVLLREGARVRVANRTPSRAQALAETFEETVEVVEMADLPKRATCDLLVNATPAGMKGVSDALPVPEGVVAQAKYVFDLVYNPPETPLLRAAKHARVPRMGGLEMLLHQAAKSFELWTGKAPPIQVMEKAAREALA